MSGAGAVLGRESAPRKAGWAEELVASEWQEAEELLAQRPRRHPQLSRGCCWVSLSP